MRGKMLIPIALAAALMCSCGSGKSAPPPPEDGISVTFIDVGKGDCILIQAGGKNVLIDTGYTQTAKAVTSFLKDHHAPQLDALIITHYDKDHVGGAAELVKDIGAEKIYLPAGEGMSPEYHAFIDAVRERELLPETVTEDVTFDLGGAEFTVFASAVEYRPEGREWNDNDVSLVTAVTYGEDSYLFTGDIEKEGIKSYLELHGGQYDVLKMPHHGKYSKSVGKLIDETDPEIAVITDGTEEPAEQEALTELRELGAMTYRSSKHGTIRIVSKGKGEYEVAVNQG